MSLEYGELRITSGWHRFGTLGHSCKFQRVSRLGSVTAQQSSIGPQPNFAALNRGRHLYSAGRSSRWALAQISSYYLNCRVCGSTLLFYYTFVITRATASKLFYNIDAIRPNNTINAIMFAEKLARPGILLQRHYISAAYATE